MFLSTPTCFSTSASSSGSLNLVLAKVTKLLKLLKLQLNKNIRLTCSRDRWCMIKSKIFNKLGSCLVAAYTIWTPT